MRTHTALTVAGWATALAASVSTSVSSTNVDLPIFGNDVPNHVTVDARNSGGLTYLYIQVQGDMHISTHTVLPHGSHLGVNGSLYFDSNGTLELTNGRIEVLNTYDREFSIYWNGGSLVTQNVTIGGHLQCTSAAKERLDEYQYRGGGSSGIGGNGGDFTYGSSGRSRRAAMTLLGKATPTTRGPANDGSDSDCVCAHANHYLQNGLWKSVNDTVQCSYGIMFDEQTVGTLEATGLQAGPSPDSIIMGGRGIVQLHNSEFAFLLTLPVVEGETTQLDMPTGVPLTETLQPGEGGPDVWQLDLHNSTCTHWFVQLSPVAPLTAGSGIDGGGGGGSPDDDDDDTVGTPHRFVFTNRTDGFNLHLQTKALTGQFPAPSILSPDVAIGNVVLASADAATPTPVSMWEIYATSQSKDELLHFTGVQVCASCACARVRACV